MTRRWNYFFADEWGGNVLPGRCGGERSLECDLIFLQWAR